MAIIRNDKLDFWLQNRQSVLLMGRPGTAKTTMLWETLERAGLNTTNGVALYSPLQRVFHGNPTTAEVIVFDDLTAEEAQLAAAKEILGTRRWRGQPVKSTCVWATLDVADELDDECLAIRDHFAVPVNIPYRLHMPYFVATYGERLAGAAEKWWNELSDEDKTLVSPRRLDQALALYVKKGDIRDVLPVQCNTPKLMILLNVSPTAQKMSEIFSARDTFAARNLLAVENNYLAARDFIKDSKPYMDFFLPLLSKERLVSLLAYDGRILDHVVADMDKHSHFRAAIETALVDDNNLRLAKAIRRRLVEVSPIGQAAGLGLGRNEWAEWKTTTVWPENMNPKGK